MTSVIAAGTRHSVRRDELAEVRRQIDRQLGCAFVVPRLECKKLRAIGRGTYGEVYSLLLSLSTRSRVAIKLARADLIPDAPEELAENEIVNAKREWSIAEFITERFLLPALENLPAIYQSAYGVPNFVALLHGEMQRATFDVVDERARCSVSKEPTVALLFEQSGTKLDLLALLDTESAPMDDEQFGVTLAHGIVVQLAAAVLAMASASISHNDLTPRNVLLIGASLERTDVAYSFGAGDCRVRFSAAEAAAIPLLGVIDFGMSSAVGWKRDNRAWNTETQRYEKHEAWLGNSYYDEHQLEHRRLVDFNLTSLGNPVGHYEPCKFTQLYDYERDTATILSSLELCEGRTIFHNTLRTVAGIGLSLLGISRPHNYTALLCFYQRWLEEAQVFNSFSTDQAYVVYRVPTPAQAKALERDIGTEIGARTAPEDVRAVNGFKQKVNAP
jgi:serine/threonine protein kinase